MLRGGEIQGILEAVVSPEHLAPDKERRRAEDLAVLGGLGLLPQPVLYGIALGLCQDFGSRLPKIGQDIRNLVLRIDVSIEIEVELRSAYACQRTERGAWIAII